MWEYKVVSGAMYITEDDLNTWGMDGWRLVQMWDGRAYLCREKLLEQPVPTPGS